MRRYLGTLCTVVVVALALLVPTAQAAEQPAPVAAVSVDVAAHGAPVAAPAGPKLDPAKTETQASEEQNKLVIGSIAAVLLLAVFLGRRSKNKHRRKVKNLQNAKG